MRVSYEDGSEMELNCHSGVEPTQITVATPNGQWKIEESLGRATGPVGQHLHGQMTLQSALMPSLVMQILKGEGCDLPTLSDSIDQHRPFLAALLKHWNRTHGCQDLVVPVT